ncbi:MAG TPA: ATP-binding protein, partial [Candidatus Thermoplasmatota archaeon]|nr:ATP-binding protein [Candidatus Thermoplasmatota archaeon]
SADVLLFEELINNLLSNAVKYSDQYGSIVIGGFVKENAITVSVQDDGKGMTGEQLNHVFDEFYKADESRHNIESSGLGMPICKRIVEKHGGKIWAESEGPGKGSIFYFTLHLSRNSYNDITGKVDSLIE